MSDELQIADSSSDSFTLKRIRSAHRRRLLDRLTDGGTTVSILARDTGLRIPHASAELRRMRNDGLVASDQIAGARGARLHLTQSGWEAIRSDELARAIEALPLPTPSNKYCLLARDGPNILLGLLAPIDTPLVLIPDRPSRGSGTEGDSTGNEGVSWTWAVLRERSPRWFNLNNMEMLPNPPSSHDPETISSYVGENHTLGIVRARLVDSDRPVALAQDSGLNLHHVDQTSARSQPHRGHGFTNSTIINPQIFDQKTGICCYGRRLPRACYYELLELCTSNRGWED